ncbi:MAG: hypothetical protein ACKVLJ_13480, partial [Cytophagales bacterium]
MHLTSQASPGAIDLGFKPLNTVAIANLGIGTHASIVVAGYTGTLDNPDYKMNIYYFDGTYIAKHFLTDLDLSDLTGSSKAPGTIGIA